MMLKKWQASFDGDKVYALVCDGPLFDGKEEEYPLFSTIPEGNMIITVLANNIVEALDEVLNVIENKEWEDE